MSGTYNRTIRFISFIIITAIFVGLLPLRGLNADEVLQTIILLILWRLLIIEFLLGITVHRANIQ